MIFGLSRRAVTFAVLGGMALGVLYTLSPLTLWFVVGFTFLCRALVRDLRPEQRRVLLVIMLVATVLRLAVVGVLFMTTDHGVAAFGSLFGDEEYFKKRSLWLRSMALDVRISEADQIYAVDEYSDTSYLYLLALLQVVAGSAPYGVHLFGIFLFLAGAVLLFRFIRRAFGDAPAFVSLPIVLFYPSLFFWSVSALRESIHFLFTTLALVAASEVVHGRRARERIMWAVMTLLALVMLKDLRAGTSQAILVAIAAAAVATLATRRIRIAMVVAVLAVAVTAVAFTRPGVRDYVFDTVRGMAQNHQGHVFTAGLHYKLLDSRFYFVRKPVGGMQDMTRAEATRFVIRALVAFVTVPLPWRAENAFTRAYVPEQMVWYALVVLLPFGVWFGRMHRPFATWLLTAYIVSLGAGIALRSGNVGTLIRHRGLLLPYMICLCAVALCHWLARRGERREREIAEMPVPVHSAV